MMLEPFIDLLTFWTIAKILAGHKISGMSDAYIKRNPKMVDDATKAIERHYFFGKK